MIKRTFWIKKINDAFKRKSVVWLAGVRRAGKTSICRSLENIEYLDCELQRTRSKLEDYETFLKGLNKNKIIVLDEIHKLSNPSELLKVAADYFRNIKIIATGSSTLHAFKKFRDTLTDRKINVLLTPMISEDLKDFRNEKLEHRFLQGGLPPFFMEKEFPEYGFQDWIDSYWAKDVQELFRLFNKSSFVKFVELLFLQSGGIFEGTSFAKPCEVSRTAINNYLKVLEETFVVTVVRPFSTYKPNEITSAPKIYAFDTGFICYFKGWDRLRNDDMGYLWEHFVLNEIIAQTQSRTINYWRDKKGHEVDFVIQKRGNHPIAIECKWKNSNFNLINIEAFRRRYPEGCNYLVASDVDGSYKRKVGNTEVIIISLESLIKVLTSNKKTDR